MKWKACLSTSSEVFPSDATLDRSFIFCSRVSESGLEKIYYKSSPNYSLKSLYDWLSIDCTNDSFPLTPV